MAAPDHGRRPVAQRRPPWHITWTQGTGSTFAFYDADGRPLRILSGRSYIAWLSSLTGEEVTVQDSAGNDLLQP